VTTSQTESTPLPVRHFELRAAAALLVISGLISFGRELAIGSVPGLLSESSVRLTLSAILAWTLLRRYSWAWWASVIVGGLWLLMDVLTVGAMFMLSESLEPLYQWPEFTFVGALIAQAAAVALLLRLRTRLPVAITLGAMALGLVVAVVGFRTILPQMDVAPGGGDLGGSIYAAVSERVGTPAVKVSIGTVNGAKGVRVVIADSTLVDADSAAQAARSREIAVLVHSLLPVGSDLEFIGIGWSLDTGPGAMPARLHRFSIDGLKRAASRAP
jgi:hypothetical protein